MLPVLRNSATHTHLAVILYLFAPFLCARFSPPIVARAQTTHHPSLPVHTRRWLNIRHVMQSVPSFLTVCFCSLSDCVGVVHIGAGARVQRAKKLLKQATILRREEQKLQNQFRRRVEIEAKLQRERTASFEKQARAPKKASLQPKYGRSYGTKEKQHATAEHDYKPNPLSNPAATVYKQKTLECPLTGERFELWKCRPDGNCLPTAISRIAFPGLNEFRRDVKGYPVCPSPRNLILISKGSRGTLPLLARVQRDGVSQAKKLDLSF